jgi:hypothetical protein
MTTTIVSTDTTDALLALMVTCRCPSGRRVLPIRVAHAALPLFRNGMAPDALILTYRCHSCRAIVPVRARDFKIVPGTA